MESRLMLERLQLLIQLIVFRMAALWFVSLTVAAAKRCVCYAWLPLVYYVT